MMASDSGLKILLLSILSTVAAQQNPSKCLQTCNSAFWSSSYGTRCVPGEISCACRMQYHLILPCCLQEACTGAEIETLEDMDNVRDACMDTSGNSPRIEVGECDGRYRGILNIEDEKLEVPTVIIGSLKTGSSLTSSAGDGAEGSPGTETEPPSPATEPSTATRTGLTTENSSNTFPSTQPLDAGFETRMGSSSLPNNPKPTSTSADNSDLPAQNTESNESPPWDADQNIGIGLGVRLGLGVPLSGLVLFLFGRAMRRETGSNYYEKNQISSGEESRAFANGGKMGSESSPSQQPSEMWTPPAVFEMPGDKKWRVELPGTEARGMERG